MGINLSGRQVGMAKHHLHRSQICAIIHKMRGKCMAQRMRRYFSMYARTYCVPSNGMPKGLTGHHSASPTGKQHGPARWQKLRAGIAKVSGQPIQRRLASRNQALLIPLARDANDALALIYIGQF